MPASDGMLVASLAVIALLVFAAIVVAVSQEIKERKQREARLEQCHIVEPVEVFNWFHDGVGSVLYGETIDGDPTSRIRTSPIELILNDGNVIETRSGSRYVLR